VPIRRKHKGHLSHNVSNSAQIAAQTAVVEPKRRFWFYPLTLGVFVFFVAVLAFAVIIQFGQISLLQNELTLAKSEHVDYVTKAELKIGELNSDIADLTLQNAKMQSMYVDLSRKYADLESKNASISSSYETLKSEAQVTLSKVDSYKKEIQSSMDWFNTNSALSSSQSNVLTYLNSNCYKVVGNECQINLGCFYFVNNKLMNFAYALDTVTSNAADKLQSLDSFYTNRKGDCEDFSLFYKAEYNSIVKKCGANSPSLSAWVEDSSKKFDVTSAGTWYLPNAAGRTLQKENKNPVVVCGSMFDLQSGQIGGHCVIAFAGKKIKSVSDIDSINSAELVEPQNGMYLGKVGQEAGVYLTDSSRTHSSYIDTIITDGDFFIFRDGSWNSYSDFLVQLSSARTSLQNLVEAQS
jgi:hypothetical protein